MAGTKQPLAALLGYMTCDDPVVKQKYENILASFYHKDEGILITSVDADGNGGTNITFSDGGTLNLPALPTSKPISFITGLLDALNTKVDTVIGKGLSEENFTTAFKNKLNDLNNYVHPEKHLISEIYQLPEVLETKVDKVEGKGLSANDFTDEDKLKLEELEPSVLSIRDENNIEKFTIDLKTENLQLSGGIFDVVNKRFTASSGTILNTYYVDCVNGSDTTGVVGNRSKPFKTIDAVFPLLTFLGTNIWEEIVLINNGTYIINSVPTINTANYRIVSDKTVLLDYSANTNTWLGGNNVNGFGLQYIIPNGEIKFSSTVNQSFIRIFDLELICKKLTTKTGTINDSLFNLKTNNSLKYVSINELILNSLLFNGGSGGGICKIEIGSIITNLVNAPILSTTSGNADIKIGSISGTGGIVLCNHKGTTTVNDINTTGQVVLTANTNDGTIIFNNSLITNSWTITGWSIGNLTLKGVIKEGSGNMVDGAIDGSSKTLTFDNFRCNLGSGRIRMYNALTFNIINSIIKFNTTFYLLDNTTTVINLYGSVGLYSATPTVICSDTETSIINDYGGLKTNIPAYGANVTFNQKYL